MMANRTHFVENSVLSNSAYCLIKSDKCAYSVCVELKTRGSMLCTRELLKPLKVWSGDQRFSAPTDNTHVIIFQFYSKI